VVDNLETTENAQEILQNIKQLAGTSRVLITSREEVVGDAFHTPLLGMPEADSIAFMRKEAHHINCQPLAAADKTTLLDIHQVTAGMPLAMKLVVSQAKTFGIDVALQGLQKGEGKIYFFIFLASWNQLSVPAKKLLLYMGPTVSPVNRQELEETQQLSGSVLNQVIKELVSLSLLNTHFSSGLRQQTYTIHQLTRYFVVNDLPAYWLEQGLI
jgi:hypothetical protein